MIIRALLAAGALALVLAGCGEAADKEDTPAPEQPAFGVDRSASESMERLAEARRAREALPGHQVYKDSCAACHDGAMPKAPHESMISMMTPEAIMRALTTGVMKENAAALSDEQKVQVAEYLSGKKMGEVNVAEPPKCQADRSVFDVADLPVGRNWGLTPQNTRLIPADARPLAKDEFSALELKWAFAYPGANRARSQPSLAGGAVHVGAQNGKVYALDQQTGCMRWVFEASGEVRTAIVIEPWTKGDAAARPRAYFGDILGNVYAIDARAGTLIWRDRPDDHPNATITGSPSLFEGRLFVPVSSLETGPPTDPKYECCKFRGSVVAYDAGTGKKAWQTYTIFEPLKLTGKNRSGTDNYGPSGAAVWNAPAIDPKRRQVYFGTAENLSSPATGTSDAMFAVDMDTGKVKWVHQGTAGDAWNGACDTVHDDNCPAENGPDFDFGAATILVTLSDGRDLVIGGQKSGMVHAVDPDTGKVVWQTPVGRGAIQGGVHFGMAAEGDSLFVGINDAPDGRTYKEPGRPGLFALDMKTGRYIWKQPYTGAGCAGREFCHAGISQVVTAASGVVLAGSMDGVLRIHDSATGDIVWQHDTAPAVTTVSGEQAHGGSLGGSSGAITANGMLFVNSGYGLYFHMPGNVMLVFGKE
ncbi:MAG: PQQ-binding-like beta-propeller repeat protein [Sphingomonadales bacterium]